MRNPLHRTFLLMTLGLTLLGGAVFSANRVVARPTVIDDRLKLELIAEAPDIVTPVDLDVDSAGRVYVIESATHFRPKDYKGPKTDRIRVFEDTDGDHRPDKVTTFHEGESRTMGLKWHPNGWLYVATRKEIFRLKDTTGDGKADQRQSLANLITEGDYPHNGLNGFAFDFSGNVFFGFGENLGASYRLKDADGTTLNGGGEGGNIYRITQDGKKLTRIATGFWNPFGMGFDAFGNLFAVDNDPGGRPPCRLLHIVEGGDYGYRYRYGRGGRHPFTSWNGEVPGTLPMIAGTGEAPCEVIAYESDNLPKDYLGKLLVTSWGDHRIEAYELKHKGASFTTTMKTVVQGDNNFRPVGMAIAPDGSVYFSDWVDKSYKLHGKGRIWRLSLKDESGFSTRRATTGEAALSTRHAPLRQAQLAKMSVKRLVELTASKLPRVAIDAARELIRRNKMAGRLAESLVHNENAHAGLRMLAVSKLDMPTMNQDAWLEWRGAPVLAALIRHDKLIKGSDPNTYVGSLAHKDLIIQSAMVNLLARDTAPLGGLIPPESDGEGLFLGELDESKSPTAFNNFQQVRLLMVLAQRKHPDAAKATFVGQYLKDANHDIRFVAAQWIGELGLKDERDQLLKAMKAKDSSPRLIAAYSAALELLDGKDPLAADQVGEAFYLRPLLFDKKASPQVKVLALRATPITEPKLTLELLTGFIDSKDAALQLEAMRTLRFSSLKGRAGILMKTAGDSKASKALRAEAIAGLGGERETQQAFLMNIAIGTDELLRDEALRTLRGIQLSDVNRELLQRWAGAHAEITEAVSKVLPSVKAKPRPDTANIEAWVKLTADGGEAKGDPATGERIFFHPKAAGCYRCHAVGGRGANIGPDLSGIARSHDRKRLLESILQPSREIGPYYTVSLLELENGDRVTAMNIGRDKGFDLWADSTGKIHKIRWSDPVSRRALDSSIMPDGLHESLTTQELRDLLAFLLSLK